MDKKMDIKHYEVTIPCETREHANNVILALVWSGYSVYVSYDTCNHDSSKFEVCYSAQPSDVTPIMEDK